MSERRLFLSGIILFLFSLTITITNFFVTHYPGNNYFPPGVVLAFAVVVLSSIGVYVLNQDKNITTHSRPTTPTTALTSRGLSAGSMNLIMNIDPADKPPGVDVQARLKELFYLLLIISLIAFATNAVQYTPFNVIDTHIITFEHAFHIHLETLMAWAYQYPKLISLLRFVYDTLPYQLPLIPLGIILMGNHHMIRTFYTLMLNTAIIGFVIYYFFPTLAPASFLHSPYFLPEQFATGIKFKQIHQHINPTTIEGGMIALPSFHAIWAMILVYCLRPWPILFWPMALFNCLLIISCVLLGWHYPTDILVGVFVFCICLKV